MSAIYLENQSIRLNNIFCIGRNYADHIAELGNARPSEPVVFMKPNACVLHNGGSIRLPEFSQDVHYETELVLLIGADSDSITPENAAGLIAGYAVGLDLTARDVQNQIKQQGLPWTKAKGFKGAACLSAFTPAAEFPAGKPLHFAMSLNGETRQQGDTSLMIFPIGEILSHLAATYGLRSGDIVFTGTPQGVGRLSSGDVLELQLENKNLARFSVA